MKFNKANSVVPSFFIEINYGNLHCLQEKSDDLHSTFNELFFFISTGCCIQKYSSGIKKETIIMEFSTMIQWMWPIFQWYIEVMFKNALEHMNVSTYFFFISAKIFTPQSWLSVKTLWSVSVILSVNWKNNQLFIWMRMLFFNLMCLKMCICVWMLSMILMESKHSWIYKYTLKGKG